MSRKVLIFFTLVVLLLLGAFLFRNTATAPAKPAGDGLLVEATPAEIMDHIHTLKSPLVLVNFWASWCEPCKEEFPNILRLRENLAAKGLQVVFVSIDEAKDLPAAEAFLRDNNVKFQSYYKGSQDMKFVTGIYPKWEGAVPTTVLIGPKMEIVDAWDGVTTKAEFERRIMRQLRGT